MMGTKPRRLLDWLPRRVLQFLCVVVWLRGQVECVHVEAAHNFEKDTRKSRR